MNEPNSSVQRRRGPDRDRQLGSAVRVALIGAGAIAPIHASALRRMPGIDIVAVADVQEDRARRLALEFGIPAHHTSIARMMDECVIDSAHVLVQPEFHAEISRQLSARPTNLLMEKPLAASTAECSGLIEAMPAGARSIYVNHNFVFHPAYVALRKTLSQRRIGRPLAISATYAMPLRQLDAGELHHWMFRSPANLLLEQAVHPLSQLVDLAGPVSQTLTLPRSVRTTQMGSTIPLALGVLLKCELCDVSLQLKFGATYPCWQISVLCTDGVADADIARNTHTTRSRSQWLEPIANVLDDWNVNRALSRQDIRNLWDYAGSVTGFGHKASPYLASMEASIRAFYASSRVPPPVVNQAEGAAALVRICEDIAGAYPAPTRRATETPNLRPRDHRPRDVVVLGGSGFIGREIVRACINKGLSVAIFSRRPQASDAVLADSVELIAGDLLNADDLRRAIEGTKCVVNASGEQAAKTWAETEAGVRRRMNNLCEASLRSGVQRIVHLSSSAALFLGKPGVRITGDEPNDPQQERRALYARAKALADALLLADHATRGLPVCILRPAIVVGPGGTPFHSAVGLFVNGRHFLGWSNGRISLPFVLASDVATAAVAACVTPGIEGRTFNLAGDVRLTAREYVHELARYSGRPFVYHPQSPTGLWISETVKWLIKCLSGRPAYRPTYRDLASRAFLSWIDADSAKHELAWRPISDRKTFLSEAIQRPMQAYDR